MPLPLKILAALMILWALGAIMNIPNLMENGLPLLGNFVFGSTAVLIVTALDIIGPLVFLYALWHRKSWAILWAFGYIGLFVLNGIVAFFSVREQLGTPQILAPTIVGALFFAVIFWQRRYFRN